jgi:hypothetical protein
VFQNNQNNVYEKKKITENEEMTYDNCDTGFINNIDNNTGDKTSQNN